MRISKSIEPSQPEIRDKEIRDIRDDLIELKRILYKSDKLETENYELRQQIDCINLETKNITKLINNFAARKMKKRTITRNIEIPKSQFQKRNTCIFSNGKLPI